MDRRAVFFLVAAVVTAALIEAVPDDKKYPHVTSVGPVLAIACVVMAVLSWLDHRSRARHRD